MLSISECKKVLNKKGVSYTNQETEKIREALYKIAEIMFRQKNNVLKTNKQNE
jgi:hypothetical protein